MWNTLWFLYQINLMNVKFWPPLVIWFGDSSPESQTVFATWKILNAYSGLLNILGGWEKTEMNNRICEAKQTSTWIKLIFHQSWKWFFSFTLQESFPLWPIRCSSWRSCGPTQFQERTHLQTPSSTITRSVWWYFHQRGRQRQEDSCETGRQWYSYRQKPPAPHLIFVSPATYTYPRVFQL